MREHEIVKIIVNIMITIASDVLKNFFLIIYASLKTLRGNETITFL